MKSLVLINYFLREDKMNDNLINALVKAQNEIDNAHKDAKNPYFKSNYATLESVIEAVKQPLLDHGILFLQKSDLNETGVCIETVFYGHGGELPTGKLHVPADKQDPQGYGSALTYARRYSLAMACGIGSGIKVEETGFDDDGNSATDSYNAKKMKSGFVFRNEKNVPINAFMTPADYIQALRNAWGKVDDEKIKQTMFDNNSEEIEKAYNSIADKDQTLKDSYNTLIDMHTKKES